MQGGDEIGAIGPRVPGAVEAPAGPQKSPSATKHAGAGAGSTVAGTASGAAADAASGAGIDVLALSSGLTVAGAQAQAERAAQLLKIVGNGAAAVNVNDLASVLQREGVVLP